MELETTVAQVMCIITIIPFIAIGLSKLTDIRKNRRLYENKH
jgi:hypothetical protein